MSDHPTRASPDDWRQFLDQDHPQAHLLQTAAWGELKASHGWRRKFVHLGRAAAMVLLRRLPLGSVLAYVPKGPLGPWQSDLLPELDAVCRAEGAFALKIEPDQDWSPETASALATAGFRPSPHSIQPVRTITVNLEGSEEELLLRMHQKTRYNIRLAERKEVAVRSWDDIAAFSRMMERTADRQGFGAHMPSYYQEAFRLFAPDHQCQLLVAEHQGEPLAALMLFARGDRAWYFYGASTPKERARMPTYALQWAAIRWARQRGCTTYDLWGVPDADEDQLEAQFTDRSDGLWGVYRFKRGFGGELHHHVGAWDRVYQPVRYLAYRLAVRWMAVAG